MKKEEKGCGGGEREWEEKGEKGQGGEGKRLAGCFRK